jgi:hypothetical protein
MHDEPSPQTNGVPADSQQEVDRLRETVKRLEAERNQFKAALYGVLRAQLKEEDVVLPDEKDCLTFDQFVHELDDLVKKSQPERSR